MPTRTARTARSANSSAKARASDIPDEGPSTALRESIVAIFADVQRSNTGHRKLVVSLRKLQEACCYEPTNPKKRAFDDDFDEDDFNREMARCVLRVLAIKKSEPVGDRIVRFLGLFLKHAIASDNAIFQGGDAEIEGAVPDTPSSRLNTRIISTLLPLLPAKDKVVRFRCAQIIANLINTLDSVDDELFYQIRLGLLKRLRDKESNVRVQAVYGLGRLASDNDDQEDGNDSDDDTAGGVLEKLLDVLQNDPSADVRRSLLLNLPLTPTTLPYLLERARDSDPGLRRALYGRLLPTLGDFRHLSLTHREKLLRWGLRDRDEMVRKHTAKLFRERWIEDCARPRDESGQPAEMKPDEVAAPSLDGLLELLERIDIVLAGNEGGVAVDAMREFWQGRPDYREFITFDEAYWKELSPESAFVVRTFNDFCRQDRASEHLLDKLPEVTRLAFLLQQNINSLVDLVQRSAVEEEAEEEAVQQEFIVEQFLHIALSLDYSDEMGRRQMFSLMREALATADVPEETTRLIVEVLRMTCGASASAERDFCGIVLEAIAEVHDTIMGDEDEPDPDESFHSARSEMSGNSTPKGQKAKEPVDEEKLIREIMVNMKCLHIAQCMLQNVNCELEENAHLMTLLNNLVVPAVRSQEAPIRERGFLCLGLCCLLDKKLADENLPLFLHCFSKGHEQLQNISIQVIGDILAAHPSLLMSHATRAGSVDDGASDEHPLHKPVHKMFSKALKSPSPSLQTTACTALSKLMLSTPSSSASAGNSILNQDELLKLLVIAYFDPDSTANPALRQALSYFIPVYCYSRKENSARMGRISLPILQWCLTMKEEMDVDGVDDDSPDMVSLSVVVAHLADWTDGRRLVSTMGNNAEEPSKDADGDVHLDMAVELLEKCLHITSREEKKVYISLLGKLYITQNSSHEKLQAVADLLQEAIADKVAPDGPTRTAMTKVEAALLKALSVESAGAPPAARKTRAGVLPAVHEEEQEEAVEPVGAPVVEPAEQDDDDVTPVPGADGASVAESQPVSPSTRPSPKEESEEPSLAPLSLNSPKKARGRPRKSPTMPPPDEADEAKENADPEPEAKSKKPRGRKAAPVKIDEDEDVSMEDAPTEVQVKLEPEEETTVVDEAAAKKARGRPAGSGRAPRKSVRASRRSMMEAD